jgi:hypothetical protein
VTEVKEQCRKHRKSMSDKVEMLVIVHLKVGFLAIFAGIVYDVQRLDGALLFAHLLH